MMSLDQVRNPSPVVDSLNAPAAPRDEQAENNGVAGPLDNFDDEETGRQPLAKRKTAIKAKTEGVVAILIETIAAPIEPQELADLEAAESEKQA